MCSTPENCHESTSRPSLGAFSMPIQSTSKNQPNPTEPAELLVNLQTNPKCKDPKFFGVGGREKPFSRRVFQIHPGRSFTP